VVVNGVASQYVIIMTTVRAFTPATNQLVVHNLALGGARANSGTAAINYSDTTNAGLGTLMSRITGQWGITADALVVCCGHNDAYQGVAASAIATGLSTMRGYMSSTAAMLMVGPKVSGTDDVTQFFPFISAAYGLADSLNVPLWDWNDHTDTRTSFAADGLVGADGFHPTFPFQAGIGFTLANLIGETS